jgi:DNA-binding NarL/FixJ family response regulator
MVRTHSSEQPLRVLFMASPTTPGCEAIRNMLALQPDMEVIAAPQRSGVQLLLLLRRTEPDVLVLQPRPGRVPGLAQVFSEHAHLTVLTISADSREITLHHLKVESFSLPADSLESVAREIRTVSQSDVFSD